MNLGLMLIKIQSWLQQPKVWRFVCFVSCIVGLCCYALSYTFNDLYGKWSWWKILLYIVVSSIICLAVLFTKPWQGSTSLSLEVKIGFLVLMITCVYSFFFDKVVKGKPDAYSLVSCAAFAIMSVCLSRLSHCGFEVDLLYFFSGLLTIQLMKIKLLLVIVGGSFSYSLIKLRSTLNVHVSLIHRDLELQVVDEDIESGLLLSARSSASQSQAIISQADVPLENEDLAILPTQIGSDSQDRDNRKFDPKSWRIERELAQQREQRLSSFIELIPSASSIKLSARFQPLIKSCTVIEKEMIKKILVARFMARIKALKKKNNSVISMISKHVGSCLKVNLVDKDLIVVIKRDDNLVVEALWFGDDDNTFHDLRETTKLMVMAGFPEKCRAEYCSWRREFLNETLSTFGLQVQVQDIDKKDKAQCLIKALIVAVRVLFPNERSLCDWVFGMFNISPDFAFTKVCTELATSLLRTADTLANFIPPALGELLYEFETLFFGKYSKSLKNDARKVRKSLGILRDSENVLTDCGHGLLPVTLQLWNYIRHNSIQTASDLKQDSDGMLSPSMQLVMLTRLFERSLKANSKNCNNPTSAYVFILNNRWYIHQAYMHSKTSIDYDWLRKNRTKIEKYLQFYQRSSWTKILNILKLDMDESEPNAAAELMKDKLRSFNEHFDDICNDQSTWFVFDKWLRKRMINSIENILLPAYGNFIGRLQDFLGNHAYEFINYRIIEIQDQLNNLFLVTE